MSRAWGMVIKMILVLFHVKTITMRLEDTTYIIGFDHVYSRIGYTFYPDNTSLNQHGMRFSFVGDWTATSHELIAKTFDLSRTTFPLSIQARYHVMTYKHEDVNLLYPFGFTEDNAPTP